MNKLYDYASILRSKNAGPLYITFDIMFDDVDKYEKVKRSDDLSDCVTSYDKRKIDEMLRYYENKGSKIICMNDLLM